MFKLLSQFKIVGDQKNITRASEIIGVSQSALTQNMARLEKSLSTKLFIRNNQGIELTEAGEILYLNTIETINAYNHSLESIKNIDNRKRDIFKIGCGFNWTHTDLFDSVKSVTMQYQDITFNIRNGEIIPLQEDIMSSQCDIAMGTIPDKLVQHSEISYIPIFETQFRVYADKCHPLMLKDMVLEEDLNKYQWVVLRYNNELPIMDKLYDSLIKLKNIQYNCQSVLASFKLVQNTNYLTFVSTRSHALADQFGLTPLKTKEPQQNIKVGLMYLKSNKLAEEISYKIIESIKDSESLM